MTVLNFTGKNLALSFIAHELVDGQHPPTSTSRPPDVIHVVGVPKPSPFFVLFHFHVLYQMKTEEQKTGGLGTLASFSGLQLSLYTASHDSWRCERLLCQVGEVQHQLAHFTVPIFYIVLCSFCLVYFALPPSLFSFSLPPSLFSFSLPPSLLSFSLPPSLLSFLSSFSNFSFLWLCG